MGFGTPGLLPHPEGTGFADDVTHLFGFEARTTLFGFLFTNYLEPTSILA